jgi:hypothetical protein
MGTIAWKKHIVHNWVKSFPFSMFRKVSCRSCTKHSYIPVPIDEALLDDRAVFYDRVHHARIPLSELLAVEPVDASRVTVGPSRLISLLRIFFTIYPARRYTYSVNNTGAHPRRSTANPINNAVNHPINRSGKRPRLSTANPTTNPVHHLNDPHESLQVHTRAYAWS